VPAGCAIGDGAGAVGRHASWSATKSSTSSATPRPKVIRKPHVAIPLLVLLAALAQTLVIAFWTHVQLPPGATVLSTVDVPGGRKEIFVAIESAGQVSIFGVEGLQKARDAITIGDPLTPGKPLRVAVAPSRGANGEVYVLDAGTGKVWIVDRGTHAVVGEIAVGKTPRWIVATPDERKAYVSNDSRFRRVSSPSSISRPSRLRSASVV